MGDWSSETTSPVEMTRFQASRTGISSNGLEASNIGQSPLVMCCLTADFSAKQAKQCEQTGSALGGPGWAANHELPAYDL
jgi:hypothetical protein